MNSSDQAALRDYIHGRQPILMVVGKRRSIKSIMLAQDLERMQRRLAVEYQTGRLPMDIWGTTNLENCFWHIPSRSEKIGDDKS